MKYCDNDGNKAIMIVQANTSGRVMFLCIECARIGLSTPGVSEETRGKIRAAIERSEAGITFS